VSDPRPPVQIDLLPDLDGDVCEELAVLAQRCLSGYSDDRPVSASLVRSRLTNALTGVPPVLAVARNGQGLAGWCAVRRPEPGEARARLWGPVVEPRAERISVGGYCRRWWTRCSGRWQPRTCPWTGTALACSSLSPGGRY
jgi:hypothetical protein